jgi:hypothetical protein
MGWGVMDVTHMFLHIIQARKALVANGTRRFHGLYIMHSSHMTLQMQVLQVTFATQRAHILIYTEMTIDVYAQVIVRAQHFATVWTNMFVAA